MNKSLKCILPVMIFLIIISGIIPVEAVVEKQSSSSSLEQNFQKAKENYLKKDLNSAAAEISKSADYLKSEAAKATGKGKEALTASANELDKLAERVKKGTVKSEKTLETYFARVDKAMAENYYIKATESWARKEEKKAGENLEKSINYLRSGLARSGKKIERATNETINKSKELSLKLKEETKLVADDVRKGFKDTENEIEKLGKKISSRD
ncbi:MAG: hypothetical protein ABFD50_20495 [Smithella sp.]